VLRTSNSYAFTDPSPAADRPNSSKSEKRTGTPNQALFSPFIAAFGGKRTARSGRKEAWREEGGRPGGEKTQHLAGNSNLGDGGGVNRRVQIGRIITPAHARARSRVPIAQRRERKILEAMEGDLDRPLTEEEERLALEPGALIEQPRPKNPPR